MRVIGKEKSAAYLLYMDKVAYTVQSNSNKAIKEIEAKTTNDVVNASDEIGMAVGQILHDRIIELTAHMSREEIIEYLAQTSATASIIIMNTNPEYFEKIVNFGPFIDKIDNLDNDEE